MTALFVAGVLLACMAMAASVHGWGHRHNQAATEPAARPVERIPDAELWAPENNDSFAWLGFDR